MQFCQMCPDFIWLHVINYKQVYIKLFLVTRLDVELDVQTCLQDMKLTSRAVKHCCNLTHTPEYLMAT